MYSNSAWVSNNVEGSYKRSVSLAMVISLWVRFVLILKPFSHRTTAEILTARSALT